MHLCFVSLICLHLGTDTCSNILSQHLSQLRHVSAFCLSQDMSQHFVLAETCLNILSQLRHVSTFCLSRDMSQHFVSAQTCLNICLSRDMSQHLSQLTHVSTFVSAVSTETCLSCLNRDMSQHFVSTETCLNFFVSVHTCLNICLS